jgi:catechol 2,3-dioxygenase-like lactoylglutathione lyase family enzyme
MILNMNYGGHAMNDPSKSMPDPSPDRPSPDPSRVSQEPLTPGSKILRKGIGMGANLFFLWHQILYRLRPPWSLKLKHLDHVTVPCTDLRVAEDFYVGVLGARVVLRLDEDLLSSLGWSGEQILEGRAVHVSLTLGAGPRIDLFEYPTGTPGAEAVMHPHMAFKISPGQFSRWKRRLEQQGIPVAGPTRPGPKGQASFYFNDNFGNHLEIITLGFVGCELPVGVPDRSGLDYEWPVWPKAADREANASDRRRLLMEEVSQ